MKMEENRNLTMLMDFYELTMANGYYVKGLKAVSYTHLDVYKRQV